MKTRIILSAAAILVLASCGGKKLPFVSFDESNYSAEAKAALPSPELTDSLAYLVGITEGYEMSSYGNLVSERVFKATADFAKIDYEQFEQAAASNFTEDVPAGLIENFEYNPGLLGEVAERYSQIPADERTPEQIDTMSYLYGILMGYQLNGLNIDIARVRKGVEDFAKFNTEGQFEAFVQSDFEDPAYEAFASQFEIQPHLFDQVYTSYSEAQQNAKVINYEEQGKLFLKKISSNISFKAKEVEYNDEDGNVATSKFYYRVVTKGTGEKVEFGDSFTVIYKGVHVDGETFDEGDFPVEEFSDEGLITGFTQALLLMREGGKLEIVIPSELGYGEAGSPDWWSGGYFIYPNEVLVFELEVADLVKGGPHDSLPMEELDSADSLVTETIEF